MSSSSVKFQVHPPALTEASTKLQRIAGEVQDGHQRLAGLSGAAAGTPGDGAFEELIGLWTRVLPHFANSGSALSVAVAGVAANYANTDNAIAAASAAGKGKKA